MPARIRAAAGLVDLAVLWREGEASIGLLLAGEARPTCLGSKELLDFSMHSRARMCLLCSLKDSQENEGDKSTKCSVCGTCRRWLSGAAPQAGRQVAVRAFI